MAKIVIDAGHGGDDPGASGNGIIEKDLVLDISNYMYDRFRELGIPVALTRSTDITLNPTDRTNKILNQFGNTSDVIVISNHINAGGGDGAEVIYALRDNNNLSNLILENFEEVGQNVRKAYQRRLPSDTSKDYYFIHRNTGNTEPIIVEYGFLDSTGDDVNQLKNNWRNLAEAVVKSVAEYTNTSYDKGLGTTYTVKSGDTLWSIAKKFNMTVNELKEINNLTSNTLRIGQILKINEQLPSSDENTYIVKRGDTLYGIANKYGVTVNEIKNLNNLMNSSLSIGQILKIPVNEDNMEDYLIYTVKNGDTLYGIARTYNITPSEIISYNNLNSTVLNIGQNLKIPFKNISDDEQNIEYIIYTVKSGDSLYSIARKYNTSVNEIMNLNNLTSNLLSIGQTLKIPVEESKDIVYTVKSGDNLYSIARKYNTTVANIKNKNNLTTNLLSIGQKLII
ncbi:MAG: LysM peptidoglycan-binding domain-containing protein [Lactobacillales bacterium]|nr:LysM peptidoglycan-binding domain-containing protein [Lactobacillales bacterium]